MREIIDPDADDGESLRFTDGGRIEWLPPREIPDGYDGLRLLARVDRSGRIGHHIYNYNGAAATTRTDGVGPGLATGLYIINGFCRRLSYREAARTHSIPETAIGTMEQFIFAPPVATQLVGGESPPTSPPQKRVPQEEYRTHIAEQPAKPPDHVSDFKLRVFEPSECSGKAPLAIRPHQSDALVEPIGLRRSPRRQASCGMAL